MIESPVKSSRLWEKIQKWILEQKFQDWIKWIVLLVCLIIVYVQVSFFDVILISNWLTVIRFLHFNFSYSNAATSWNILRWQVGPRCLWTIPWIIRRWLFAGNHLITKKYFRWVWKRYTSSLKKEKNKKASSFAVKLRIISRYLLYSILGRVLKKWRLVFFLDFKQP